MADFQMFVVDIDGTLLTSQRKTCPHCGRARYTVGGVNADQVARVNKAYTEGAVIILHTARGWDLYRETSAQLRHAGVHYHELVMGKPGGVQVDADAKRRVE